VEGGRRRDRGEIVIREADVRFQTGARLRKPSREESGQQNLTKVKVGWNEGCRATRNCRKRGSYNERENYNRENKPVGKWLKKRRKKDEKSI